MLRGRSWRDHRGDVDDAATTSLEHAGHQAGGQKVGAADVGVERLLERRDVLADSQRRRKAGRVVDQYVDVSSLRYKRFHRLDIWQIGLDEAHAAVDARGRGLAALCVSTGDDDRGTLTGQQPGASQADASGSAGDQCCLID
jgi:hypothetical protein